MRLRRGKQDYKIPAHFQIMQVSVESSGAAYALGSVLLNDWFKLRDENKNLRGLPQYYHLVGNNIMVWPVPDKAYYMTVRYLPPVCEA